MNSFFPHFESTTITSMPYKYEPLDFFINKINILRSISSGETQISTVLDQSIRLLNKYISAKEVFEDDLKNLRESCKGFRGKGYRAEVIRAVKDIFDSVKFIDTKDIIVETLENFILNNLEDSYGLLIESVDQWNFISSLLQKNDLHEFIQPIYSRTEREQYFEIPVITFLPAYWIPQLLVLPPAEKFILIHPENSSINGVNNSIFKAPDNQSLEVTIDNFYVKKNKAISVKSSQEFYSKFSEFFSDKIVNKSDMSSLISYEQPLLSIEILDNKGKSKFIECNKEYLVIAKDGKIRYSTFENNEQIQDIIYIVDRIDASCLTSEDLKRQQNLIMEKWKKPLRDHPHIHKLIKELERQGAIKASIQNIKNWYDPDNIAPRTYEDYMAVLSFSGITDKQEIERFFDFARKRRGDSISEGHDKKSIGLEIVREYLEGIKKEDLLKTHYQVQGIQFSLIALR